MSKPPRTWTGALKLVLGGALLLATAPVRAEEPYDINVLLTLTGNASFVGQTARDTLKVAEKLVNESGGIKGRPAHFVYHDDQTNPQVAVQLVNQIGPKRVPILLGSTITAECGAIAPLVKNGPFTYCLSPGVHPAPGSYMFSALVSLDQIAPAAFSYFRARGWTRVALLTSTDASGQDAERGFQDGLKLPENAEIKLVAREHFAPADLSVAAQIGQIKAAQPQVVIGWSSGSPAGTILKGLSQAGLDLPVMIGQANLSYQFMAQYAEVLPKELYLPSGLGSALSDKLTLSPKVAEARQKYFRALTAANLNPENGGEAVWDATMIVIDALRSLGTDVTAAQVLEHVQHLKNYSGISGDYDFEKHPQRGLGSENMVIARWNPAAKVFEAVSQPGGAPIQ